MKGLTLRFWNKLPDLLGKDLKCEEVYRNIHKIKGEKLITSLGNFSWADSGNLTFPSEFSLLTERLSAISSDTFVNYDFPTFVVI